jgi:predicted dehydrogenase
VTEVTRGGVFKACYDAEWRHLARVARTGEAPGCTVEDARRTLAVALAAARSADEGRPVAVAELALEPA